MQRGTVRPRSPADEEEDRPRQRYRLSSSSDNILSSEDVTSSHHLQSSVENSMSMGLQMQTNGSSSNGVATNDEGSSVSTRPQLVKLPGKLMYQDDSDWAEYQGGIDAMNNDASAEGSETAKRRAKIGVANGKRMPVDREEVVRLILQGLRDIGYDQSADMLEAESGYQLSTRNAIDFQAAVLGGRWSEALGLLAELAGEAINLSEPSSSSSSIASGKTKAIASGTGSNSEQAKFLISQQKYLEYLEAGLQKKALVVLRSELAHSTTDSDLLHTLSGYMMCMDKEDLYERASWDGAAGTSRRQLLERLQAFISPRVMVPSRRLATLLDQARRYQQQSCMYHDETEPGSLYVDHECSSGQFPTITTHILADHTDEVWRIEWSPDGMKLASAGKDQQVVIWELKIAAKEGGGSQYSVSPLHHLRDHHDEVDALSWSPDGKTLVTAGFRSLYMWDTETGLQKTTSMGASQHNDTISSIQWMPDGSQFIVSSMDCKLIFYGPTGTILKQWSFNALQIVDFAITPDMKHIVASTTSLKRVAIENKLKPSMSASVALTDGADGTSGFGYGSMEHNLVNIRLADREIVDWSQDLRNSVTCVKLSWDGKRILTSCADEVQMWNFEPHLRFVRKFTGHVHNRFLIRSGFAATKDRFVMSGSEDGHVYVWQSNSSNPIEVLSGHSDTVNSVAWNPVVSRRLFASCSDDSTIRIWQPPSGISETDLAKDEGKKIEEGMEL